MLVVVDVAGGLPCASDWGDENVRQAAMLIIDYSVES